VCSIPDSLLLLSPASEGAGATSGDPEAAGRV
jgi:hypothetical protein